MAEPLPPTTLTWLRQSAAVDGAAYSQVLLHLLERVEALEQQPTCKQSLQVPPTPEAAPVAIANNLHSPPPFPPTLAEAREAARQLAGPCAEVVHAFLSTLEAKP